MSKSWEREGSGDQAISARLGHQYLRLTGLFLDLLAKPVDMRLQRVSSHRRIVAPNLVQQRFARHRLARTVEEFEDVGFLLGQANFLAFGIYQDFCTRAECIRPNAINRFFALLMASQMRMNTCDQRGETEGLCDVIVRAGLKAFDDIRV